MSSEVIPPMADGHTGANVLPATCSECERHRKTISDIAWIHQEWGNTGEHHEAFKELREAINKWWLDGRR